mmetsp:Transcript_89120/g.203856  ORF Transcript_89120/g.203856 Transcript_89120/m.203856 type:complete len:294 (+) Transcript_89120:64-945(+)
MWWVLLPGILGQSPSEAVLRFQEARRAAGREEVATHVADPRQLSDIARPRPCACVGNSQGIELILGVLPTTVGAFDEYGVICKAHDRDLCTAVWRGSYLGNWCCRSWCWVDPSCPSAHRWHEVHPAATALDQLHDQQRAELIFAFTQPSAQNDFYFSYDACPDDEAGVQECAWGQCAVGAEEAGPGACGAQVSRRPAGCDCIGANPGVPTWRYGQQYGTSCHTWDAEDCDLLWSGVSGVTVGEWCCESWCYVASGCSSGRPSRLVEGLFYSYDSCDPDLVVELDCPWRAVLAA